ncbi:MAG: hypothetical protein FGM33_07175 [Candidatus Kapabacteria bacterium]|nr:hypothetical protein [Candidatus Kapabacteria bacterium]
MAMVRPLILIALALTFSFNALAQGTVYVRAAGSDSNDGTTESSAKKTIQAAVKVAQSGDIIDVGPGSFAGASLDKGLVLQGSNANYDIARWDVPTVITSTVSLDSKAAGASVTLIGLQFGGITPLAGRAENAMITIYNCKFIGSKPIITSGTNWAELFFTASILDGKPEGAKQDAATATALVLGDVGVVVFRENVIRNYAKSAIDVAGSGQIVRISYNEFSLCNSSVDVAHAAVRIEASAIQEEMTVENCLFTSCATSVSVAGTISGKTVSVQRNSFLRSPAVTPVIRCTSPTALNATCNAFNIPTKEKGQPLSKQAISAAITKLATGNISTSPTNIGATDKDGTSIGYEPIAEEACAFELAK